MEKEKTFWDEEWKPLTYEGFNPRGSYEISNYGRVKSYAHNRKIGKLLKPSIVKGMPYIVLRDREGKPFTLLIAELVARNFLPKSRKKDARYVIHLDYNRMNTYYKNLAWKTKEDRKALNKTDPNYRSRAGVRHYSKLSEAQVKLIKRKLNDPNRKTRMKLLARQFGISEMQLYRIKSGKNWSDVEPIEENK